MLAVNVKKQFLCENVGVPRELDDNFNLGIQCWMLMFPISFWVRMQCGSAKEIGRKLQSGNPMLDVNASQHNLRETEQNVGVPRKLEDNLNLEIECWMLMFPTSFW
eukprot:5828665-Karenia_brevis.AAC.1